MRIFSSERCSAAPPLLLCGKLAQREDVGESVACHECVRAAPNGAPPSHTTRYTLHATSKIAGGEGVARLHGAAFEAAGKPAHALLRASVCKGFRRYRTRPPVAADRSSPIALAAFRPSSMSPASSSCRDRSALCAQMPAKQSAWSSCRTDSALASAWLARLRAAMIALGNAQQRLHMMPDLMCDDVRLREIARRAEPVLQLLDRRSDRCTPCDRPDSKTDPQRPARRRNLTARPP